MNWVSLVAYLLDLVVTAFAQYSYILQKQGHLQVEQLNKKGINAKVVCNCRWLAGFFLIFLTSLGHIFILPYADLVLLTTNSAAAVVITQIMSILILKEKLMPKYDIPAIILIISGGLTIIFLSNYEEVYYSSEQVEELMLAPASLVIYGLYAFLVVFTLIFNRWFRKGLMTLKRDSNIWLQA